MTKEDDDIEDIVRQLSDLQLQQNKLLARLQERAGAHEVKQDRPFKIGDQVTIKNPNPFQETKGRITRIGEGTGGRITVTTPKGKKIIRAPKNLALE